MIITEYESGCTIKNEKVSWMCIIKNHLMTQKLSLEWTLGMYNLGWTVHIKAHVNLYSRLPYECIIYEIGK